MLTISLDEGYVFDILAVIEVKNQFKQINNNKDSRYFQLWNEIANQIGQNKLEEILKSKEYKQLFRNNETVFNFITTAQKDKGLAGLIDKTNYKRFISKTKLQKKFFKTKVTEIKIGYNK